MIGADEGTIEGVLGEGMGVDDEDEDAPTEAEVGRLGGTGEELRSLSFLALGISVPSTSFSFFLFGLGDLSSDKEEPGGEGEGDFWGRLRRLPLPFPTVESRT